MSAAHSRPSVEPGVLRSLGDGGFARHPVRIGLDKCADQALTQWTAKQVAARGGGRGDERGVRGGGAKSRLLGNRFSEAVLFTFELASSFLMSTTHNPTSKRRNPASPRLLVHLFYLSRRDRGALYPFTHDRFYTSATFFSPTHLS